MVIEPKNTNKSLPYIYADRVTNTIISSKLKNYSLK